MKYILFGGAGFIGSYCVTYLLSKSSTSFVCVYDNFSSGKYWHLKQHSSDKRLKIIESDIKDNSINSIEKNFDVAIILAANPDISKAVDNPRIDFDEGTLLTQIILEALRKTSCRRIIYSSGSGVYGEAKNQIFSENYSPLEPISTYGASKLACEALISSYSFMFDFTSTVLRFGNVVGGRQTHGVAYDFIKRLLLCNSELLVLGDGQQDKPYIHIDDVISAIDIVMQYQSKCYEVFNVAPLDTISVNSIANLVMLNMNISSEICKIKYTGGIRGWKGDVPTVKLNTNKIRKIGWLNRYNSTQSVDLSIKAMIQNKEFLYGGI